MVATLDAAWICVIVCWIGVLWVYPNPFGLIGCDADVSLEQLAQVIALL
jgi:hypothetical protein